MIKKTFGLDITEAEYRDLPLPSYSLLSDMVENGTSVIGGKRNEEIGELEPVMFGKIVDSLLTDKKMPENIVIVNKRPTGKAKEVIKALCFYNELLPNSKDFFHEDNEEVLDKVCVLVKFFKKKEIRIARLKNYIDFQEKYLKVIEHLKSKGEIDKLKDYMFCTDYIVRGAKLMATNLESNFPYYFRETPGVEVHYQVKLTEKVFEVETKCMLDGCVVDHNKKEITPFDLKTGSYDVDYFEERGLIGWKYYLQAALYRLSIVKYIEREHPELKDYTINSFLFIYSNRFYQGTYTLYSTDQISNFVESSTTGSSLINNEGKEYKIVNLESLLIQYQKHIDDN